MACPINRDNQYHLAEIIRKFENSHASCFTLQHAIFGRNRVPDLNPELLKKQLEEIKRNGYKIPVMFFPDIKMRDIEDYYLNPDFPGSGNKCLLPWFLLIIQPNGDVVALRRDQDCDRKRQKGKAEQNLEWPGIQGVQAADPEKRIVAPGLLQVLPPSVLLI